MLKRRRFLETVAAGGSVALLSGAERLWAALPGAGSPRTGASPGGAGAAQVPTPPYALVLGSVQDGGVPQAGCYTERCDRARNDPRFVTSLALVMPAQGGGEQRRYYLVDASPDLRVQMDLIDDSAFRQRAQARRPFDGIFLTHAHMGHYLGLAYLGRESLAVLETPVYCSAEMREFLSTNGPWSLMVDEGRLVFPKIEPDTWHPVDGAFEVRMSQVPHRPEFSDTVAFEFRAARQTLLYLPDIDAWNRWDRRIEDVVADVDVALLDGAFFRADEVPGRRVEDIPHPMIPDTMARLEHLTGDTRRIVFTHINNTNPVLDAGGREAREVADRGFEVAREGMVFAL